MKGTETRHLWSAIICRGQWWHWDEWLP